MKILLLDDDRFVLKLLIYQLANLGFHDIAPYERAPDALYDLESDGARFEIVILDLQMPDMDGVQFMRHLARIDYSGAVLLVSGEDERILNTAKELARVHRFNVLGALRKPTTSEQLWSVLGGNALQNGTLAAVDGPRFSTEELRHAIAAGELTNYYQPKVDLATGRAIGMEALVRWQHPSHGTLLPGRFIAMAEEQGMIDELTDFVLTRGLDDAGGWHGANLPLSIAVNVSMDNLAHLDFPDRVSEAARTAGVPPSSIVLEVTESRLMRDRSAVLDILTRLRLKHVGLAIDDFGTGYASLAQLRDIPFDELKVDQGFVHDAHFDTSLRAILEASLGMAQRLGIKTVAEGIENLEDWNFLRRQKCDVAQGYFIGKPMPAAALGEWLSDWAERSPELLVAS